MVPKKEPSELTLSEIAKYLAPWWPTHPLYVECSPFLVTIQVQAHITSHSHPLKMQAALSIAPALLPLTPSKNFTPLTSFPPKLTGSLAARFTPIKATAVDRPVGNDTTTVDYSSATS